MNLANRLTLLRIVLALATFLALINPDPDWHMAAFVLFLAAIITDWIDGYVARKTQSISAFGKVADPIADKILVLGTLLALMRARLGIPLWGVFLIVARELLMGGLRVLTASQGKIPQAEKWGKWKMGVQSVSVLLMLGILVLRERIRHTPDALLRLPYFLTLLCVIVAWQSAYLYYRQSRKTLEKSWG